MSSIKLKAPHKIIHLSAAIHWQPSLYQYSVCLVRHFENLNLKMDKLVKAIKKGDARKVGEALQDPACNVNGLDAKSGKSMLQVAMENGETEIFQMLIDLKGVDLNVVSRDGEMLLETAILVNSPEFVDMLLRKKCNPKRRNGKGESAMSIAVKNSINPEILKKLIHNHFDVNEPVDRYGSLTNLAIVSDQFETFKELMSYPGINLKLVDEEGNTGLLLATKLKKADFVEVVLQKLKKGVFTPIQIQFYLNHQDEDGNSALHIAAIKDLQTIEALLLRSGEQLGLDTALRNKQGKDFTFYKEQRKQQAKLNAESESRRLEEKIMRKREKEEEKKRQAHEQQMLQAAERRRQKEEEVRVELEMMDAAETLKKKRIWGCGIFIVALLGITYLVILNAIPQRR